MKNILNEACRLGLNKVVREQLDAKAPIDSWAIDDASVNGHVEIVRMLLDAKAPIDHYAIARASENGHIEIVKMLKDYLHIKKGNTK